ncbi:MAG: tannase/feruloyl esterase family alpha/beta hydrolase [Pseudomonadota bacterium]
MRSRFLALLALAGGIFAAQPALALPCSIMPTIQVDGGQVTAAVLVPGPTYLAPDGNTYTGLPPFCKVSVVATPTPDSLINIEVWLPQTWNGRFEGVGNGGYAGSLAASAPAMVVALRRQFAVASTDLGTVPSTNNNGDALTGHPQKWADFGYRATHLMTTIAKQLVTANYGNPPQKSYFNGCSTGGQQALMTAQRYPADYDGILVGAPAANRTHIHTGLVWNFQAQRATPTSSFGSDTAKLLTAAVANSCAVSGGGVAGDGFLTDPRSCQFDPGVLQCSSVTASNCLSPELVTAARRIYQGATNPANGERIAVASTRGAETDTLFGWQSQGRAEPQFGSLFKWVFGLTWQGTTFDFNSNMASVDSLLAPVLNATNPDLSAFRKRGGKMIGYHGTADPLIPVQDSINYYHRVAKGPKGTLSNGLKNTRDYYRLFVVPGMGHCAGGPGPNAFGNLFSGAVVAPEPPVIDAQNDAMVALQHWVEAGAAPEKLIATKYSNDLTGGTVVAQRPICAYPKFPKYLGVGDTTKASSYTCEDNGNALRTELNPMPGTAYLK